MSSIVVAGDTSGSVTLQAPAVAGSTVLTLPAQTGTVMVNGPAFSAYQSTLQALPVNTYTKILFQTEEFDTNNNYDTATSRFTPTVAGYYQVNACYQITPTACQLVCAVYKNGAAYKYGGVSTSSLLAHVSAIVFCNGSTDYIEIFTSTTTAQNSLAGIATTYFQAAMIRGA
tara:strand:+ start:8062 stop:8577 length:516 start_codon:yes stop_codon:yes gene_type:complete